MNKNLKIGDRVRLSKNSIWVNPWSRRNPENYLGTVVEALKDPVIDPKFALEWINVLWDNGYDNNYDPNDSDLIKQEDNEDTK